MPTRTRNRVPWDAGSSTNRLDDLEACPNRPFRVVLVRPRIAEAAEDPVAHDPDDRAIEPADLLSAGGLVRDHDLPQVFGIEAF